MNPEELSKKSPLELDTGEALVPEKKDGQSEQILDILPENIPESTSEKILEVVPEKIVPPPQPTPSTLKSLRTYQGDVEEIMGKQKTSTASIVIAEQKRKEERRENEPEEISQTPSGPSFISELKNKSFLTLGISLLILGVIGVGIAYYIKTIPSTIPEKETILSYSKNITISTENKTGNDIMKEIVQNTDTHDIHLNSIVNIDLVTASSTQTNIHTILSQIAPHMPSPLTRAINDAYMFGIFSSDKNYPFIILKTSDYGASWNGMLGWEERMVDDLRPLFNIQNDGYSRVFIDETIQNKDLRIVLDQAKKTVLIYSFLDKNTILITSNENVFTSILGKFIESKIVR